MTKRIIIFLAVVVFYIINLAVPLVNLFFTLPVGLINIVVFLVALFLFPKAFEQKIIAWLAAYFVVLEMFVLSGIGLPSLGIGTVEENKRIMIEMAYLLPIITILCVGNYLKDRRFYEIIGKASVILLVVSFLYYASLLLANVSVMRANVSEDATTANPLLPNYTLMHAFVFLVPGILYKLKYGKLKQKIFYSFFLLLTIYVIINTQITTSMVLVVFFLVFYFIWDESNYHSNFLKIFAVSFLMYALYEIGTFKSLADFLVNFFEGTAAEAKMQSFKDSLEGNTTGDSYLEGRENLHVKSLVSFFDNFLIGNRKGVGGHSFLLDRLGGMGLVGFVPYAMLLYQMIKMSYKIVVDKKQKAYFTLVIMGMFVFFYEKGLFGQEGFLFSLIILPGMFVISQSSNTLSKLNLRNGQRRCK